MSALAAGKSKSRGKGKAEGHWITVHGHGGVPHHIFIAGPRPKGMGHGKYVSLASAKGVLTRGIRAQNGPAAPGVAKVETAQGTLATRHTTKPATMRSLRGRATKGTKYVNVVGAKRPSPTPTYPSAAPHTPLATGRGTPARKAQVQAIREGMAASKSGSPGSVPYPEARRNYLGALKPGMVKRQATSQPAPAVHSTPAPTHPSTASPPKVKPIIPRGTPERQAVASQIRQVRRSPDTDAARERLANLRIEGKQVQDRQVKALPAHEPHIQRVEKAFDELVTRTNTVRLDELRAHPLLRNLSRAEQDAAIHHLRKRGRLTMNSHEGRERPLTKQELRSAIREGPGRKTILPYLSRPELD